MRFAKTLVLAAFATALGGCAAVGGPSDTVRQGPPSAQEAPVAPAAQRAFEEAASALRAGRIDEAERGFRAVALAHPELAGPHANLGVIYRRADKLDLATVEFEQAVKLNPKQPIYFNQLGVTYRQQGQFDKARVAYAHAIELDPSYAAPVLNLGILSDLYLSDSARALELYGRYLSLAPGGDPTVTKWVADLKRRKPTTVATSLKEKG